MMSVCLHRGIKLNTNNFNVNNTFIKKGKKRHEAADPMVGRALALSSEFEPEPPSKSLMRGQLLHIAACVVRFLSKKAFLSFQI